MTYYHFTLKQNINSIRQNGLIPLFQSGLSLGKKSNAVVYLTTEPQYIQRVVRDCRPYVRLEIDIDGLPIEPENDWSKIYVSPEFYPKEHTTFVCKSIIPPGRIHTES